MVWRLTEAAETPFLDETISREADNYAYSRAYDDVVPDYQQSLDSLRGGMIGNVADLRAELKANQRSADALDSTLSQRAQEYQQQRMKYRDARQQALSDIQKEKDGFASRNEEINQSLDRNKAAEQAAAEQSAIGRGEIPVGLKQKIEERAGQIKSGLQRTALSEGVRTAAQKIDAAHWSQRQNAFRAGISHMLQGKSPDVEPFFDLTAPELREPAMNQIRQGPRAAEDTSATSASREADASYQRSNKEDADLVNAQEDFEAEMNLARNMVDDLDSPDLREALNNIQKEANDDSIMKGLQAYASCMLRRI